MNKTWHEKGKSVKSSYIAQFVVQEYLETTEKCPTRDVFNFSSILSLK